LVQVSPAESVTEVMWLVLPTSSLAETTRRLPGVVGVEKAAVKELAVPDSEAPVDWTRAGWALVGMTTENGALRGETLPAPSKASMVY